MHRYKDRVFRKVFSLVRNREEAEDLTQDVFVKVFNGLPTFRSDASFSTWLYAITMNTYLNYREKMLRRPWWWITEDVEDAHRNERLDAEIFYLLGRSQEAEDLHGLIERTMAALSPSAREVLRLRYFEGLDYQAVADRLKLRLSAAKMRIKRAREEFRTTYDRISKGKRHVRTQIKKRRSRP